ncbi:hypothetical protein E8E15_005626 [Penicillium rubens]|nr:hypothetical protein E8E15_005626 [Penicillium rubens]
MELETTLSAQCWPWVCIRLPKDKQRFQVVRLFGDRARRKLRRDRANLGTIRGYDPARLVSQFTRVTSLDSPPMTR